MDTTIRASAYLVGWVEVQISLPILPKNTIGETQHPNLPLLNTDNVN